MGRFTLRDLGQTISPRAAREYLAQRGWQVREDGPRLVCEGPPDDDGRPILHFLPAEASYADYPLRLEDLISTLSVLEDRPAVEIAAEMVGFDEPALRPTDSLADDLVAELSGSGIQLALGKDLQQAIAELRPLVAGPELGTTEHLAALLAVRFVRLVVINPASKVLLCRLCDRVLTEAGVRLQSTPEEAEEFWRLASRDDPAAPDAVLEWIRGHAKPIRSKSHAKGDPLGGAERAGAPGDSGGLAQ